MLFVGRCGEEGTVRRHSLCRTALDRRRLNETWQSQGVSGRVLGSNRDKMVETGWCSHIVMWVKGREHANADRQPLLRLAINSRVPHITTLGPFCGRERWRE
ncbi:hypothetical protein BLNAU_9788 [Blattamonas nauphoetae]|uniref:Uncharacterized protein n=1 Tax=Blattamonas nauphoetae TaxID=2049346 RepID=A0ABQ9XUT9_9EUKA|nr:hypothetical protein BLNAU_9788 [Blattamonas nauphoetae]